MLDTAWRDRLATALSDEGKSLRSVSLAAGAGPGYLHSVLKEGKEPTIGFLLAVCDAIPVSPIFILLGIDAEPEDVALIRALHERPDLRDGILAALGSAPKRRAG